MPLICFTWQAFHNTIRHYQTNWGKKYLLKMRNFQRWKNHFSNWGSYKDSHIGWCCYRGQPCPYKRNSYLWSWPTGKPSLKRSMEEGSGKQVVKNQDQCPQNVFRKFPCKYELKRKSYSFIRFGTRKVWIYTRDG